MNRHKNGTYIIGEPGSYQWLLSALEDILKGKAKVYEVHHLTERLKEAGLKIGLSKARLESDYTLISRKADPA